MDSDQNQQKNLENLGPAPPMNSKNKVRHDLLELVKQAQNGHLFDRPELEAHGQEDQELIEEVNNLLDKFTNFIQSLTEGFNSMSKGQIPEKISQEFQGDFDQLKNVFNQGIDNLNSLTEINQILKAMDLNDYGQSIQGRYPGVFGELAKTVNKLRKRWQIVTRNLENIADGDFYNDLETFKQLGDGTGRLSENDQILPALIELMEVMDKITQSAKKIAQGDLSDLEIYLQMGNGASKRSDNDELVPSLIYMMQNINDMIGETNGLTQAAIQGRLDYRAESNKFKGSFKKVIDGINETMDAVVGPLNMASEYVEQISKGIIPEKITEDFNGDFSKLKNNLNQCVDGLGGLADAKEALQAMAVNDHTYKVGLDYVGIFAEVAKSVNTIRKIFLDITGITQKIAQNDLGELDRLKQMGNGTGKRCQNDQLVPAFIQMLENLQDLSDKAQQIAQGDLTVRIQKRSSKDTLMTSLQEMKEGLGNIAVNIQSAADQVASGSQEISSSSQNLSEGASEQASSIEEISSSMEEIAGSVNNNAQNARETASIAEKAASEAQEGGKAVSETVKAMKSIADKISIIEEIARQTNMLALNAAIEAARAGEQGKGFAVVASEVRKLAEKSQNAAKEIGDLSGNSLEISEKAGKLIQEIVPGILKTSELVQEINAASSEQAKGIDQIKGAVQQLDQVIQQNASSTEELASTSEELSSQAEQLQDTAKFFKTDQSCDQVNEQVKFNSQKKLIFGKAL